jgi:hypothetical protein
LGALVAMCVAAVGATPAQAASHALFAAPTATGTADCSAAANACDIATAVTTANALPDTDTASIELAGGTYSLAAPTPTALVIAAPAPAITITAAAGADPVLDGTSTTRPLQVGAGTTVTIDGVDFAHGLTIGLGGAILDDGTLTVKNATFTDNRGGNGGAISNTAGGTLAVENATFSANTTTAVGGGAIIAFGTTTVTRSALLGNTAPINGGAINAQPSSTVTVSRSTFSGNTSGGLGGAMSNLGTTIVQGSTIVGNQSTGGSAIATGNNNATFAANIIGPQTGDACNPSGTAITDAGYNLDVDGTCVSDTTPGPGSHNGTTADGASTYGDVLQAYLADAPANNGGPTQTFSLLNTPSPATELANPAFDVVPADFELPAAIDGTKVACATGDQRGVVPVAGARCAIGSYLLQATTTTLTATKAVAGQSVTITATVVPAPDGGTVAFNDGAGHPATNACAARPVVNGKATCTVTYPAVASYSVTATYTGDGAQNNFVGSAGGPLAVHVTPAPLTLSGVSITPRCLSSTSHSLRLSYTLSRAARVTFTLQQRTSGGLKTPRRCPSPLPKGTNNATYTSGTATNVNGAGGSGYVTVSQTGAVTRRAGAARRKVPLAKTIASARGTHRISLLRTLRAANDLAPGRYRVVVQAAAADGPKSKIATVWFWVLRPR